jgi:hypothetical protein
MPALSREPVRQSGEELIALASRHGAHNVRMLGSVARDEPGAGTDLGPVVDVEPGRSLRDMASSCPLDQFPLRRRRHRHSHAPCSLSMRLNGIPAPYLSIPIMLGAASSCSLLPTPAGASALNTSCESAESTVRASARRSRVALVGRAQRKNGHATLVDPQSGEGTRAGCQHARLRLAPGRQFAPAVVANRRDRYQRHARLAYPQPS